MERADSLFDAVVEDLLLLRPHGKDPVEIESILLWTRPGRCRSQLAGCEVVIEGNDILAAFALFD